jgi:hypothetical protein
MTKSMKKRFGSQEDSSDQGPVNIEKVPKEKQKKVILKGIYLILGVVLAVFFFFQQLLYVDGG